MLWAERNQANSCKSIVKAILFWFPSGLPYFFNQTLWLLFFRCSFLCGYSLRAAFISSGNQRISTTDEISTRGWYS